MCSPSRWAPFSDRHCKSRLLPATWARRKTARPSPTAQSGRIGAGRREGTHCRLPFPNLSLRPPQAPGRLRGAAARLVAEVPSAVLGRSPRRRHVRRTFAARQRAPRLRERSRPGSSSRRARRFTSGLRQPTAVWANPGSARALAARAAYLPDPPGRHSAVPTLSPHWRPLSRAAPSRRIVASPAAFDIALN